MEVLEPDAMEFGMLETEELETVARWAVALESDAEPMKTVALET